MARLITCPLRRWQEAWRDGFAPELSTAELRALYRGLVNRDEALDLRMGIKAKRRRNASEKALEPLLAGPLHYALWKGRGLATTWEISVEVGKVARHASERLHKSKATVRSFFAWLERAPYVRGREELTAEVSWAILRREGIR